MKDITKLGEIFVSRELLCEEELENVLHHAKLFNLRVGDAALELGYVSENDIVWALSEHTSIPVVDLKQIQIDEAVLKILPEKVDGQVYHSHSFDAPHRRILKNLESLK